MCKEESPVDLDVARYRRNIEARSGLNVEVLIAMALEAEANGAPPENGG